MTQASAPSHPVSPGFVSRRRRRKDARPAEILDAALEVFSAKGFAAARPDEIAARAGISKGTLYLYFPSKEELFKAMVRQTVLPNVGELEEWAKGFDGSAAEMFRGLLARIARIFTTSAIGRMPKIIISEATAFPDLAQFWVTEVVERAFAIMRGILDRGVAAGDFSPIRVEAVIVLFSPLLMLAVWNHSIGPAVGRSLDPDLIADEAARILLDGLRVREGVG
ncbi:TetR/AcrR family transcriptional regulator [Magnetospirillum molischianum]|uniref:HTH tetR-type domain-containing protein n=1 Tax=Magnetospirillum molischianum DSM 120 TaxID=1150626 RepID=H8FQZ6_MAGML|nr:TetR/AcrR family transcriptional regulator [Magnetospirillum molischianum]CCG40784.1 conserved hypothetical protein [Magnetospirillum molischianum DSM 120]